MKRINLLAILLATLCTATSADEAGTHLFLDDELTRVEVTMDAGHLAGFLADPWQDEYRPCTVRIHNATIDTMVVQVGIRVRGNTSRGAIKKSWKLSFNAFVPGREVFGLEKLNLNGEHNDPSISRSRLGWDLLAELGVAGSRARHALLTINDGAHVQGVAINVEQIDDQFLRSRFGNNDGNLYKCLYKGDRADLGYVSPGDGQAYRQYGGGQTYVETNTDTSSYGDLATFIDFVNHADPAAFAAELPVRFSLNAFLKAMAADVVMGNWDNYWYGANNYYLYANEDTGRFEYIPYDLDNTYGVDFFGIDWAVRPYHGWGDGGYGSSGGQLPVLMRRILDTPVFEAQLRRYLLQIVGGPFTLLRTEGRIDAIQALLAPHAYQGSFGGGNMDWAYTPQIFAQCFETPAFFVNNEGGWDHGLKPYHMRRVNHLRSTVPVPPPLSALRLNEFMASNDTTLADEAGEYDDWVEIVNTGSSDVDLGGYYLTDDLTRPMRWAFPDTVLAGGGHLIVWCDDDPEDGPLHATFKLSAGGEDLALYAPVGLGHGEVDRHRFGPQTTDVATGRATDGDGAWGVMDEATPGAANADEPDPPDPPTPTDRASLGLPFPNPARGSVNLVVEMTAPMGVRLDVFDLRGRRVCVVHDGPMDGETLEVTWDGRDDQGRQLASGSYIFRLRAAGSSQVRRLVLLR